jgi:GntR family transcriptional regulator
VPAGSPVLAITRTTTDTGGVPFEFSYDLFRGDRIRITVRTPGERAPGQSTVPPAEPAPGRVIELRPQTAI